MQNKLSKFKLTGMSGGLAIFILCHILLIVPVLGIGTQFLALPGSTSELTLGINPVMTGTGTANPALLSAKGSGPNLSLAYGSWLADVVNTKIGVTGRFSGGIVGLFIRYAGLNDMELRTTIPTDEPLSEFGANGVALDLTYSRQTGWLQYGVTLRTINIQLYTESSSGWAVDLGLVRHYGKKVMVGLSMLNIGSMSPLNTESPGLPLRILTGVGYRFIQPKWKNTIHFTVENSSKVNGPIFRVGNEFRWKQLTLQMGSQFSREVTTVSGGFGIQLGSYHLQYGIRVGSKDLGIPQMIDVSIRLP